MLTHDEPGEALTERLVVSRTGLVYHRPDCPAMRNRVAVDYVPGMLRPYLGTMRPVSPCSTCKPPTMPNLGEESRQSNTVVRSARAWSKDDAAFEELMWAMLGASR